jgi:hypothetical protein
VTAQELSYAFPSLCADGPEISRQEIDKICWRRQLLVCCDVMTRCRSGSFRHETVFAGLSSQLQRGDVVNAASAAAMCPRA